MPRRSPEPQIASSDSDEDLVAACLAGEERAWDALVDGYAPYIYAVISRAYGYRDHEATEVFQDACIRVYLGLRGFGGRSDFRSWLRAVVISACREHVRQAARHPADPIEDSGVEAVVRDLDEALDVRRAVDGLGEPCRTTVALHFFEDLTQAEVASRLGVPPGTVAARISRCLTRLRSLLQENDSPSPSGE